MPRRCRRRLRLAHQLQPNSHQQVARTLLNLSSPKDPQEMRGLSCGKHGWINDATLAHSIPLSLHLSSLSTSHSFYSTAPSRAVPSRPSLPSPPLSLAYISVCQLPFWIAPQSGNRVRHHRKAEGVEGAQLPLMMKHNCGTVGAPHRMLQPSSMAAGAQGSTTTAGHFA